ncbi:MAG: hypothetical protein ABL983_09730 [Nitrospira sp.]
MKEPVTLVFEKITDRKVRYIAYNGEAHFKLYIPQRRIPDPWPRSIRVSVEPYNEKMILESFSGNKSQAIDTVIHWDSDCKNTTRYRPDGEPESWEIGEPYIPHDLLPDAPRKVRIKVDWEMEGPYIPHAISDPSTKMRIKLD